MLSVCILSFDYIIGVLVYGVRAMHEIFIDKLLGTIVIYTTDKKDRLQVAGNPRINIILL